EALAAAPLDRVLKLWEGLGYYTRARHLHRAAQVIVHERAGTFPNQFEDVLALPGIGRYTAGAICSIAFNQPTPILDGNVVRVLTRLFAIESDPRKKKTSGLLWQRAETLVRRAALHQVDGTANCSHLNQALMELGATICTAREPNCKLCPVRPRCFAFKQRRVTDFPKLTPRPRHTIRHF